jgi:HD superfamily phosphodiesterase
MDEAFFKIFELASSFLDTRENEAHTRIAYAFAARLLSEEGGDPNVVLPAIILHDVGWKRIPEELQLSAFGPGEKDMKLNRIHEMEGAKIAGEILEQVNYPPHLTGEITEIILGHDSRKEAISLNDAIVKDSDKLWRYSAHGVQINFKRFTLTFPQHLNRLRNELDNWFLTRTGKNIAREELRLREGEIVT